MDLGLYYLTKTRNFNLKPYGGGGALGGAHGGGGRRASSKNDIDNSGTILIGLTGGDASNYVYIYMFDT